MARGGICWASGWGSVTGCWVASPRTWGRASTNGGIRVEMNRAKSAKPDNGLLTFETPHSGVESFTQTEVGVESKPTWKWRLVISYDGTNYSGWQLQPRANGLTVQYLVEDALAKVTRCTRDQLLLCAAGRTDAGVHAWGQVAHFVTPYCFDQLQSLHTSLNGILPYDIRVREVSAVQPEFHARFSALRKTYQYRAYVAPVMDPFQRSYAHHIRHEINAHAMQEAASYFVGEHDFSAFANTSNDPPLRPPIRKILQFNVLATGPQLQFEVEGTGFLYKQVRNMVGLLIEIGKEVLPPRAVCSLVASQDRKEVAKVARTAPPNGLYLMSVVHDDALLVPSSDAPMSSYGRWQQSDTCSLGTALPT